MSFRVSKPKSKVYPRELITIGDHLRKKRLDMKLSPLELSKILGVKKQRISQWENNGVMSVISNYPKIIQFLGYDPLLDDSGTLQAEIENYRRKNGLSYKQLANLISINRTSLIEFVRHNKGSQQTIEMIQKFFRETSN